jgi:Bacterial TSP3 repeat
MLRVVVALGLSLPLLASACAAPVSERASASADGGAAADHRGAIPARDVADRDGDGLCDKSEADLGTDPDAADTDHDGFPDALEVLAGFNPTDASSPSADQLAYLAAEPGQTLALDVRTTIDGNGEGATGQFVASNAFDRQGLRASDFFVDGSAVSAEPPENVRGIQANDERFQTVLGKTRLSFQLRFAFADDHHDFTCAAGLPFDYAVKGDVGSYLGAGSYLLVVTRKNPVLDQADFCRPVACI